MRYILDVSGHDLKLIRASIVNFQRSLENQIKELKLLKSELKNLKNLLVNGLKNYEMSLQRTYSKKKVSYC